MFEETKKLFFITKVRNWYAKFERPLSSFSLIGGFVFDALTLRRVDTLWENVWVFGHLLIVAVAIIMINREEGGDISAKDPARLHFWLVNILQFFFGGLLSTYLVFYFRSGSLSTSWPFILFLALAFFANESFKRYYVRITFQISLFYLSLLSFAIFLVPIILHQIGDLIFLASGLLSLIAIIIFLQFVKFFSKNKLVESRNLIFFSIAGIFISVNALYFFNVIPPIPLSLKDSGLYHSVTRNTEGNYVVEYEDGTWWDFLRVHENFHATTTDVVYAYSAIFSPSSFKISVFHEWQRYDDANGEWQTVDRIDLPVIGGRDGGYRTYSNRTGLTPGEWRVNVVTTSDQLIGRIRFTVISPESGLLFKFTVKN